MLLIFTPLGSTNSTTLVCHPSTIYLPYHQYTGVINVPLHLEALITTHWYHFFKQFLTWSLFSSPLFSIIFSYLTCLFWHPVGLCGLSLKKGGTVMIHAMYQESNTKSGTVTNSRLNFFVCCLFLR